MDKSLNKGYLQPRSSTKKVLGLGQDLSTGRIGYWGLFTASSSSGPGLRARSVTRSSSTYNGYPEQLSFGRKFNPEPEHPEPVLHRRPVHLEVPVTEEVHRELVAGFVVCVKIKNPLQFGSILGLVAFGCLEAGEP